MCSNVNKEGSGGQLFSGGEGALNSLTKSIFMCNEDKTQNKVDNVWLI